MCFLILALLFDQNEYIIMSRGVDPFFGLGGGGGGGGKSKKKKGEKEGEKKKRKTKKKKKENFRNIKLRAERAAKLKILYV